MDVALKMIPKKKVKGNESSVWGEMEVLKGLDHPNIVSIHLFLNFWFYQERCSIVSLLQFIASSKEGVYVLLAGGPCHTMSQ